MRRTVPVAFLLLFAFAASAHAQATVEWERTGFSLPDYFGANTERGMAFGVVDGNPRVFVASRSTDPALIRIIDAETGLDAGSLSSNGVEGGYLGIYSLNDVGVSDDGVIFGSNMTLSAGEAEPFRVYRWDDEASDPTLVINYEGAPALRLGDHVSVTGSVADNSLVIYAPAARSNQVVRFTTEDNAASFSAEIITAEGFDDGGIQPSVAPVTSGDGGFYYNASPWEGNAGRNPSLHAADGSLVSTIAGEWLQTNTLEYFEVDDRAFLATFDGPDGGDQRVALFDVTGGNAVYMYHTPSMGTGPNLFSSGDLDAAVGDEGEVMLYAMAANTGVAAYRLELPEVFAGHFTVGEVSQPGMPHYGTLAEAFSAINDTAPTGAITLHITSDLDERGSNLVLSQPSLTAETPLTIRPAAGVTPTITLSSISEDAGATAALSSLAILSTGHVTIDGSANGDGSSRDLTIVVDDEAATRGILIHGDSPGISIRNTNIATATPGPGVAAIRIALGTLVPEDVGIENNQIGTAEASFFHGVALVGNDGLNVVADIRNNDIYASQRAITTFWVRDSHYEGNRIWITGEHPTTSWSAGVYLVLASGIHVAGNEILSFTTNTESAQFNGGVVLNANLGDVWIYNNMVAVPEFSNNGTATDNPFFGIGVNNAAGAGRHFIYHNTVRVGASAQEGTVGGFGWASGLSTTPQEWTLRNNIFVVEHDAENGYAIHWPLSEGNTPDSDDNNLYVSGSSASVGNWRGTDAEQLNNWQFTAGLDGNSVSKPVDFVSETDLRLTGASVGDTDLAGAPLEAVAVDIDGTPRDPEAPYMGAFEGSIGLPIEDRPVAELPESFELHQNYPNPFNPSTTISYTLREPGHVRVRVFNAAGQLIRELADSYEISGTHEVRFDAGDLASGMYLYRVEVDGRAQTKQMVLVK